MGGIDEGHVRGCLLCRKYRFSCKGHAAGARAPCAECELWSVWLQHQAKAASKAYRWHMTLLLAAIASLILVVAWVQLSGIS